MTTLLIAAVCIMHSSFTPSDNQTYLDYIDRFKDIAIQEMYRTGIPASIKLAQAIQESGAGTSELAQLANNHFGIKCSSDWTGQVYYRKDDDYNDQGDLIESCFRVYRDAGQSYVEHSEFLKRARYSKLFTLEPTDYRAWAKGLQEAGYATDRSYSTRLIDLIERYQLYQYDRMGISDENAPITPAPAPPVANAGYYVQNDVKFVYASPNEPLESIARRTGTAVSDLLFYNENFQGNYQILKENTRVYLQPKRNYYRGKQKYHVVRMGETMYDIAQNYGVKLDQLYSRNRMALGTQPAQNEEIKLRGSRVRESPRLSSETPSVVNQNPDYLFEEPIIPVAPPPSTLPDTSNSSNEELNEDIFEKPVIDTLPTVPVPVPNNQYHIVNQGDTLWNIAQRYNTTVDRLKELNKLDSNIIHLGTRLRVR